MKMGKRLLALVLCAVVLFGLHRGFEVYASSERWNVINTYGITGSQIVQKAKEYLGTPYTTHGSNYQYRVGFGDVMQFDCSGFVYRVCRDLGLTSDRKNYTVSGTDSNGNSLEGIGPNGKYYITAHTHEQKYYGTDLQSSVDNYKATKSLSGFLPGDLLFYDYNSDGTTDHVDIYIGDGNNIGAQSSKGIAIHSFSCGNWRSGKSLDSYLYAACRLVSDSGTEPTNTYTLDVNGWLDSAEHDNLENYGTCDVRIKRPGEDWFTWTNDKNDYYESLPAGTQYSIEDIRPVGIHSYHGLYSGGANSLSGTLNSNTKIMLSFRTNNLASEYNSSFGDNFYAYIKCVGNGLYVSEQQTDKNVCAYVYGAAGVNQLWHFERQSNNAYKVTSAATKYALDAVWPGGGTVGTAVWAGTDDQLWAIHFYNGCCMLSPVSSEQVADAGLVMSGNYNNVHMLLELVDQGNQNQLFALEPVQLKLVYNSNGATTIKKEGQIITEEALSALPRIVSSTESLSAGLWDGDNPGWIYLERPGYTMETHSWNTKADGTGISIDWKQAFDTGNDLANALGLDLSTGSKTVTLYMEWKPNHLDIIYNSNGATSIKWKGEPISEQTLSEMPHIIYPTANQPDGLVDGNNPGSLFLERPGYTLETRCWNTKADGTGISVDWKQAFDTGNDLANALGLDLSTGSKTITLYAEWTPNTYEFAMDSNGGSGSMSGFTATYGVDFTIPVNTFTKTGDTFTGWNVRRDNDNKWYVGGQGWFTDAEIAAHGYTKRLYQGGSSGAFEHHWTDGYNGVSSYTFFAVWRQMADGIDRTLADGTYIIASASATDKSALAYLDIAGSAAAADPGTNVQIAGVYDPASFDTWTLTYQDGYYEIAQFGTNMVLEVANGSTDKGANVQVGARDGSDKQKWVVNFNWRDGCRIVSKVSGMSLDLQDGDTTSGTNVRQWTENNGSAESWFFIPYMPDQPVEEGRYVLLSRIADGWELDISYSNYGNVQLWNDTAQSKNNSFDVIKLSNGYYKLVNAALGKALAVENGLSAIKCNVHLADDDGSLSQQWAIISTPTGYKLIARCSGMALDVADGAAADGTNIRQYNDNGSISHRWTFVAAEYTVAYDANGGSGAPEAQTKYYKTALALSSAVPVREGFTFLGWADRATSADADYQPGESYTSDANTVLYAIWQENAPAVVAVTEVSLSKTALIMAEGSSDTLIATVIPDDATDKTVTWTSSDDAIATVNDGTVTAVKAGTATITASAGDKSACCTVTVQAVPAPDPTAPQIVIEDLRVTQGETFTVPVVLKNNPGIAGFNLQLSYDTAMLELIDKAAGDFTGLQFSSLDAMPFRFNWDGGTEENTGTVAAVLTFRAKADAEGTTALALSFGNQELPYDALLTDIPFTAVGGEVEIRSFLPGDANGDGAITMKDSTTVRQHLAGWTVTLAEAAADANGDGAITMKDSTIIRQYLAGWPVTLGGAASGAKGRGTLRSSARFVPQIIIEDLSAAPGDTVSVPILLKNNPGIAGFDLAVSYDTAVLTLTGVTEGDFSGLQSGRLDAVPFQFNWDGGTEENAGTVAAVLTFRVSAGASGSTGISVSANHGTMPYDSALEDIAFEFRSAAVTVRAGGASIRSLSLRGGVASVELECLAKNAGVYCAAYAVGGRMLALLSSPVDGDGTYSFTFHETQIAYVKAFLLDGGAKPLCESMTAAAAGA